MGYFYATNEKKMLLGPMMRNKLISTVMAFGLGLLTLAVLLIKETTHYQSFALFSFYGLCSWNFYAYAFDKGMMPRQFVELDGNQKGKQGARTFVFWIAAGLHMVFLSFFALGN